MTVLGFQRNRSRRDRTIVEYANEIWEVKPCPVP
jgi:hypothetical protein